MKIESIHAQEIIDSRGNPTVATKVRLANDIYGWAAVPSGSSKGKYEALELRDGDLKRYRGQGVLQAVEHVNGEIAQAIVGMDAEDQHGIDAALLALDGTPNKARLGANAILSVSLAVARAEAHAEKKRLYMYLTRFNPQFDGTYILPIPLLNVMNGGMHANWSTDIQEYMLIPHGASSISEAIRMGSEVYNFLKEQLKLHGYSVSVGDEGGFAPSFTSNSTPFTLLTEAVNNAGYELGKHISFGIDAAASEYWKNGGYYLSREDKQHTTEQLIDLYQEWLGKYQLVSLEDHLNQDDWDGYDLFNSKITKKIQTIGDDLYATNIERLKIGIEKKSTNAILIKVNQIGTLTETIAAILMARSSGMQSIVSHRSGETEDSFIADLVVAMGTGQLKSGAPARSERTAKYNRLMQIELENPGKTRFAQFPIS